MLIYENHYYDALTGHKHVDTDRTPYCTRAHEGHGDVPGGRGTIRFSLA